MPWDLKDFFGVDGYVGPSDSTFGDLPLTLGGPYGNHLPGVGEEDDMTAPVPPMTGYTQWGTIDTPFAQPNRGSSSSSGGNFKPSNTMGR